MKQLWIFILTCLTAIPAQAVVIDDFSGDLSNWTNTVILDTDPGGGANDSTWRIVDGKIEIVTTVFQSIEQHTLIYAGLNLAVGQEVRVGLVHNGGSQDLGLYVGGTVPQTGVRQDYITIYARFTGEVFSRGFDGTTEYGQVGWVSPAYDKLFIARTDTNTFEAGYYVGEERTVLVTRTPSYANAATYVGLYADVRAAGVLGALDDFEVISVPGPPIIVSEPNDVTTLESENASFETVFTSPTTPSVAWYKVASPDDLLMDPNQSNIDELLTYDSGSEQYTSTLSMTNLTIDDGGQYYCRVNNDFGVPINSTAANLTVYGLIAHWTLDQDRSSYVDPNYFYLEEVAGNDAVVNGTPTFVTGADGTASHAIQITAGQGWALCPVLDPVKQSGQLTVSFWANWSETLGTKQDLLAESILAQLVDPNGLKADNHWQHICTIYDGSTGKLYVDGVLRDQSSWQLPSETDAAINIGIDSYEQNPFNGALDDVRIYNYALTTSEVAAIYNAWNCSLEYDFTGPDGLTDCTVDLYDLNYFAAQWLILYNMEDFAGFAAEWLLSGP